MSEPKLMDEANQRSRRTISSGLTSLKVEIANPHHMRDAIAFVKNKGQEHEFFAVFSRVWGMFLLDAMTHDIRVVISPDSPRRPSFAFTAWSKQPDQDWKQERHVLSGGLIYRDEQGWSVHT